MSEPVTVELTRGELYELLRGAPDGRTFHDGHPFVTGQAKIRETLKQLALNPSEETLIHHLREQALLEGTRCSETRGQGEESIAISSMHAGRAQAYNSIANWLEADIGAQRKEER